MPATFRPAASNAVAIPSLQAVRRESLGAGMRSGEADFSSGMGWAAWPLPCPVLAKYISTDAKT